MTSANGFQFVFFLMLEVQVLFETLNGSEETISEVINKLVLIKMEKFQNYSTNDD